MHQSPPEATVSLSELLLSASEISAFRDAASPLFYQEAKGFKDDRLVALLIEKTSSFVEERLLLFSCLELCRARWSPEAQAYCENVAQRTSSPRAFAEALDALPTQIKSHYAARAIELTQQCLRMPIAEKLISAMRGIRTPEILAFLVECANQNPSRNAGAALDVLRSDFPAEWRGIALNLLQQPHCDLNVRMKILDGIMPSAGHGELDQIEPSVLSKGRVTVRIHFLSLCLTHHQDRLPKMVTRHWDRQPVPVTCQMIECLWLTDRTSAKTVIIERALRDTRVGTRVAAARVLGADASIEATDALLGLASHDDSKWVRLQAVRSLLAPGRELDEACVRDVTRNETAPEVLQVLRDVLRQ